MGSVRDLAASLEQDTQLPSIIPFLLVPDLIVLVLTQGAELDAQRPGCRRTPRRRVPWKSLLYQRGSLTVVGPFCKSCSPDPETAKLYLAVPHLASSSGCVPIPRMHPIPGPQLFTWCPVAL